MVILAENGGRATLLLLEDSVKVADILEPAAITYFSHAIGGIDQKAGSMTQTRVNHVVRTSLTRSHTE